MPSNVIRSQRLDVTRTPDLFARRQTLAERRRDYGVGLPIAPARRWPPRSKRISPTDSSPTGSDVLLKGRTIETIRAYLGAGEQERRLVTPLAPKTATRWRSPAILPTGVRTGSCRRTNRVELS